MRIVLTRHAQDMMIERGISIEFIQKAIKRGSKTKQTQGLLATYQYIRVAYYVHNQVCIVKTVTLTTRE